MSGGALSCLSHGGLGEGRRWVELNLSRGRLSVMVGGSGFVVNDFLVAR